MSLEINIVYKVCHMPDFSTYKLETLFFFFFFVIVAASHSHYFQIGLDACTNIINTYGYKFNKFLLSFIHPWHCKERMDSRFGITNRSGTRKYEGREMIFFFFFVSILI